jgi:hypothetical protein
MGQVPKTHLIGDGRLARHLSHYFTELGIPFSAWSRRAEASGLCLPLQTAPGDRVLLAIRDEAIEPFIGARPELSSTTRVHFSGSLVTKLAHGAHPLFSFADTLYDRETYARIPFIRDRGSPALTELIPGIPNRSFEIEPGDRARYHALCVLAGNFTTLLWRKLFFELEWAMELPREQALPYLESTVRGLSGPGSPLSGPLARGDQATLEENLAALDGDPFQDVYRAFVQAFERQNGLNDDHGGKDWLRA